MAAGIRAAGTGAGAPTRKSGGDPAAPYVEATAGLVASASKSSVAGTPSASASAWSAREEGIRYAVSSCDTYG